MNVLFLSTGPPEYIDVIKHFLPNDFHLSIASTDSSQFLEQIGEADFLIGFTPVTEEMIKAAKRVKLIQAISAGYDNIDVFAAAKAGVPVATTGGVNAVSVAEHIFTLILALHRRIVYAHNAVRAGDWPQLALYHSGVFEVSGKTIGLIGFGNIGQTTARIAQGFGMQVLYYRRNRLPLEEERSLNVCYASLEALIRQAEIVSIQVPFTPQTKGLIGRSELGLMKRTAFLINTSRGAVVDEEALIECLAEGRIAGAGLDVFAEEPIQPGNPLLQLDNVVLTPHVGGAAQESVQRTLQAAVANILRVAAGEEPRDVVSLISGEVKDG